MEIQYINRQTGQNELEKVYGAKAVEWLYSSFTGKLLAGILVKKIISQIYGKFQDYSWSKKKIAPFCQNYNINLTEFLPEEGRTAQDPYSTFNQFFIRKFVDGAREFDKNPNVMPAFCEARYIGHKSINNDTLFPVS